MTPVNNSVLFTLRVKADDENDPDGAVEAEAGGGG